MTNRYHTVIYTGMTNDMPDRVGEHRSGKGAVFTSRYRVHKLVYYEHLDNVNDAIRREKQIKAGSRQKKIELIESVNPLWEDLYDKLEG